MYEVSDIDNQVTYWGEIEDGRCESIEIPLSVLGNLLNRPAEDVKEQVNKWHQEGRKTDVERCSGEKEYI